MTWIENRTMIKWATAYISVSLNFPKTVRERHHLDGALDRDRAVSLVISVKVKVEKLMKILIPLTST